MSWIAGSSYEHAGAIIGSGQCVAFVQQAAGCTHTSAWRCGIKVRSNNVESGTAIATFDPSGRYGNHTDGRSHAAILIAETKEGLLVWDQWHGQPVHRRTIRFHGGVGKRVNDGDAYHVIEG